MPETVIPEQADVIVPTVESHAEKAVPEDNGEVLKVEEEEPVIKVVEVQDSSQVEAESQTKIENAAKKSYASIVSCLLACSAPSFWYFNKDYSHLKYVCCCLRYLL